MSNSLIAGVELGGTKAVAVLAREHVIVKLARFPTISPQETLPRITELLASWRETEPFAALGIASFGPVRVDPHAEDYGRMLATPKAGWSHADIAGELTKGFDIPWQIDTDVNAAALAERRWGAAKDLGSVCYITIGTGVGGGLLHNGVPAHGALHPEVGHLKTRRAVGDTFAGTCPFHGDCVEGLIAGPALQARFGQASNGVPDDHPNWSFVAHDLAALLTAVSLTASPSRIVIGGGIGIGRPILLDQVRAAVLRELNGYLSHVTDGTIDRYIVLAGLGENAGPLGAIALGLTALDQCTHTTGASA